MSKQPTIQRMRRAATVGAVALAGGAALASGAMAATEPAPQAQAARTLNVRETVNLRLVRKSGSTLYERGTASGTLPGTVSARFETSLTKVTGSVTIYPRGGGSLTINVFGRPRTTGLNARFAGTMAVRRGTGRYARAVGSGTFTGTVNRRTWAVTVNARARLTY